MLIFLDLLEDCFGIQDYKVNDYDITSISYHIDDNLLSVGSTSFGS